MKSPDTSSEPIYTVPYSGDGVYLESYEKAEQNNNTTSMRLIELDIATKNLSKHYRRTNQIGDPMIASTCKRIDHKVQTELENEPKPAQIHDFVAYFHLKTHSALLPQSLLAPIAFAKANNIENQQLRQRLAGNVYQNTAAVLNEAVNLYDTGFRHRLSLNAYGELRGVINELTALALLNRPADPDYLTVLAHTEEDHLHKTDLVSYYFNKRGKTRRVPIQIKSSDYALKERGLAKTVPLNGYFITAEEMNNSSAPFLGNRPDFLGAKLVIQDANGINNGAEAAEFNTMYHLFKTYTQRNLEFLEQPKKAKRA